jgi:hypothetical protein
VPKLKQDDNVIPSAHDIPEMLTKTRKRTISVGPQSEADVREFIANRDQRRRDSLSNGTIPGRASRRRQGNNAVPLTPSHEDHSASGALAEEADDYMTPNSPATSSNRSSLRVSAGQSALLTPPPSDEGASSDSGREDEQQDKRMFSALEKPRIRYDVEVITKVVVYTGIGWLAIEGNPLLFQALGLV